MKQPCSRKMLELLTLAALKHHEISEGRAVELLGWSRRKIREQMEARVGRIDRYHRMADKLDRAKQHWEEGVSEDTEKDSSWHGTMRDILWEDE